MISNKNNIVSNYSLHPKFRFESKPFEINLSHLEEVNNTYSILQNHRTSLKKKSWGNLFQHLSDNLNKVFRGLQRQVRDKYEACFIRELEVECARVIEVDLYYYYRSHQNQIINLDDQERRISASKMAADHFFTGQVSASAVHEMMEVSKKEIQKFRSNASLGLTKRVDLSINSGSVVRGLCSILNAEFNAIGVLDVFSAYTGKRTCVRGLALELSVSQAVWWKNQFDDLDRPPRTLYAHFDESVGVPKAIVYLSDVIATTGPTSCYPGSYYSMELNPLQEIVGRVICNVGGNENSILHQYYSKQYHQSLASLEFRKHFMLLPPSIRFNSHIGWDVLPNSDLEKNLVDNEIKVIGKAGTFIGFDGNRLLHRGGMVENGERIALQVILSDLTFKERINRKIKSIVQ